MALTQKSKLKFRVSSGIKDIVGRDLIPDDNIALFELVKNSYDAHATKVKISFLRIHEDSPSIIVEDNGKGMDYSDLQDKWLFLAYSAKKDGTEDKDYRNKIYQGKPFAGSKGIGRFSSDRLGKRLLLETIKDVSKTRKETLEIDWTKFENKLTDEFIKIPVTRLPSMPATRKQHGTILTITDLRDKWDRKKLIGLKNSLAKLISPESNFNSRKFEIVINCPEEEKEDLSAKDHEKINGNIKNFIFEDLEIRTTKISVYIDEKGQYVTTELKDGGTLIYKIKEKSIFPTNLHSISFTVFYLNRSAKSTFRRRMGVRTREYGSIFVYKNGIRIYPYGEPTEDSFNLDKEKAQKPSIKLGNKDLIGRLEIGNNKQLNETSSRGDGFIKNETYQSFLLALNKYVIDRLERYVIDVQKWGGDYLSIEDEGLDNNKEIFQDRIISLISKLSNSNDIVDFQYDDDILNIIDESQSESVMALVSNLFKIAKDSNNKRLLKVAETTKTRVGELIKALDETQKEATKSKKELEEKMSENLFLQSIKSQDFDEIVSFMHHTGIYAQTIEAYLKNISLRINRKKDISNEDLKEIVRNISIEAKKILTISEFATKANFKLHTEDIDYDIAEYFSEYINNIIPSIKSKEISVQFVNRVNKSLVRNFKPLELNIIIDNLIDNAKKAEAKHILIELEEKDNKIYATFKDDGNGIPMINLKKIFDFGFTTTSGSGLGLFHIDRIVKDMNGKITVENNSDKGVTFKITI